MSNTINNANEIQVINNNGTLVVSSRKVAEDFGKRHDKLLFEIERMYGDLIAAEGMHQMVDTPQMFFIHKYIHPQNGQSYKEYLMNRDGFSLLVMGFTGSKALEWKLKYINAFNAMEKKLKELSAPQTLDGLFNIDNLYLIVSKLKKEHDGLKSEIAAKDVTIAEQKITIKNLEAQVKNTLLLPETLEVATDDDRLYTVTDIATEFGITARLLNQLLLKWNLQRRVGAHYELCEGLDDNKYVHYTFYRGSKTQMKWTGSGRLLIHNRLNQHGYSVDQVNY